MRSMRTRGARAVLSAGDLEGHGTRYPFRRLRRRMRAGASGGSICGKMKPGHGRGLGLSKTRRPVAGAARSIITRAVHAPRSPFISINGCAPRMVAPPGTVVPAAGARGPRESTSRQTCRAPPAPATVSKKVAAGPSLTRFQWNATRPKGQFRAMVPGNISSRGSWVPIRATPPARRSVRRATVRDRPAQLQRASASSAGFPHGRGAWVRARHNGCRGLSRVGRAAATRRAGRDPTAWLGATSETSLLLAERISGR